MENREKIVHPLQLLPWIFATQKGKEVCLNMGYIFRCEASLSGRAANFSQALSAGGHTINPTDFAHFVKLFNILTSMQYHLNGYIFVSLS